MSAQHRKLAGYRQAIEWLAFNDDNEWTKNGETELPTVAASMVAHLFGRTFFEVHRDLTGVINRLDL